MAPEHEATASEAFNTSTFTVPVGLGVECAGLSPSATLMLMLAVVVFVYAPDVRNAGAKLSIFAVCCW